MAVGPSFQAGLSATAATRQAVFRGAAAADASRERAAEHAQREQMFALENARQDAVASVRMGLIQAQTDKANLINSVISRGTGVALTTPRRAGQGAGDIQSIQAASLDRVEQVLLSRGRLPDPFGLTPGLSQNIPGLLGTPGEPLPAGPTATTTRPRSTARAGPGRSPQPGGVQRDPAKEAVGAFAQIRFENEVGPQLTSPDSRNLRVDIPGLSDPMDILGGSAPRGETVGQFLGTALAEMGDLGQRGAQDFSNAMIQLVTGERQSPPQQIGTGLTPPQGPFANFALPGGPGEFNLLEFLQSQGVTSPGSRAFGDEPSAFAGPGSPEIDVRQFIQQLLSGQGVGEQFFDPGLGSQVPFSG